MVDEHTLEDISAYYSRRVLEHGATSRGVDWKDGPSHQLRFQQLMRLFDYPHGKPAHERTVNDFGCGYGALLDHLHTAGVQADYRGYDISADMIAEARKRHRPEFAAAFIQASMCDRIADYSFASGIFNVKLNSRHEDWLNFTLQMLNHLFDSSASGFAFNCLTQYSDAEKMRNDLYYGDPSFYFDICKRKYSKNVSLIHDYDLYEFTILVRK